MLAYFMMDTVVYALPKKDGAVIIHHIVIIYCHALVGTPASSRCTATRQPSLDAVLPRPTLPPPMLHTSTS